MAYELELAHIEAYWRQLVRHTPGARGTTIPVPYPYLVPTANPMFSGAFYYWDSYFTALGLVGTAHEQLIVGAAQNLASLFRRYGIIPNANQYYFLTRSQPPFFTRLIWLAHAVKQRRGDADARGFLRRLMRVAEREHETVWLGTKPPHDRCVFRGLSRYFDLNYLHALAGCESGWDHSTRCDDRWLDHLPVDLNAILHARELDFARAAELAGETGRAAEWRTRAATRAETMNDLMWSEPDGIYYDYDYKHRRQTIHPSLATFAPLWSGLATQAQADRLVRDWLPRFAWPGGLVTTLEERPGRQWAAPNGWAPLQWLVTEGLERYGYAAEARRLRLTWLETCTTVFRSTRAFWEKYNVRDPERQVEPGLYGQLEGFGWTNAVFIDFTRRVALPASEASVA